METEGSSAVREELHLGKASNRSRRSAEGSCSPASSSAIAFADFGPNFVAAVDFEGDWLAIMHHLTRSNPFLFLFYLIK